MNDKALSINDIIKKGISEQFTGTLNPLNVLLTLGLAFAVGLFIFIIYRKTFAGVMYSRSFNLSLIMVTVITALIILPISSNITLSLGMVGALSIVRFRTAVKDAMDTMFMFWGIACGICLGAGFYAVAGIGSLFIGLIMVVMSAIKLKSAMPYLLVIHYHESATGSVRSLLAKLPAYRLKAKSVNGDAVELTIEVRIQPSEAAIVDKFLTIDGVYDASLISYQGDVIS